MRILQEALTNVLRHAQAGTVTVDLYFAARELSTRIIDDGVECVRAGKPDACEPGSMQDRADKIGAVLKIAYRTSGTELTLAIPLENPVENLRETPRTAVG